MIAKNQSEQIGVRLKAPATAKDGFLTGWNGIPKTQEVDEK